VGNRKISKMFCLKKKVKDITHNKLWKDKNIFKVAGIKWHAILKEGILLAHKSIRHYMVVNLINSVETTKKLLYIMKRRLKRVGANLSCLSQLEEPCMMTTR
jgi:hypothetical protein